MPRQVYNATICGVQVNGMILLAAKYPGYDPHHKCKIKVGDAIVYKRKDDLTPAQHDAIFGKGKRYNLTVLWPLRDTVADKPVFTPSDYQKAIRACLFDTSDHILISALAGTGKTSTLVWLVHELADAGLTKKQRIVYMAFNTSIADELNEKLRGTGVPALTTHSFGFRLLKSVFGNSLNVTKRDGDIFIRLVCDDNGFDYSSKGFKDARQTDEYKLRSGVLEMVGYIKNWAIFPERSADGFAFTAEQRERIRGFIDMYEIEPPDDCPFENEEWAELLVDWACRVTAMAIPLPGEGLVEVSFDDMLYLPLALNLSLPYFDLILTDESQDFNACQVELLNRLTGVDKGSKVNIRLT